MRGATMIAMSALLALGAAGCGSSSQPSTAASSPAVSSPAASSSAAPASSQPSSTSASSSGGGSAGSVGALSAEAQSAATGDIPDNQVFLTFADQPAGYSMSYPEGWARKGDGADVTFADKNNLVHIVIAKGAAPTAADVGSELAKLQQASPTLKFSPPHAVTLKSGPAIKATYTTESAPNPVTGKTVLLIVDRYEFAHAGQRATVDLGTAKGVDNVDAYRMMINSFRWR